MSEPTDGVKSLVSNDSADVDACGDDDIENTAVDDLLVSADCERDAEREVDALADIDALARVLVDTDSEARADALTCVERLPEPLMVVRAVSVFESAGVDEAERLERSVAADVGDAAREDAAETLESALIVVDALELADALAGFVSRELTDAERDTNALFVSDASAVESVEALTKKVVRALADDVLLEREDADTVDDSPALRDADLDARAVAHSLEDTKAVPLSVGLRVACALALGDLDAAALPSDDRLTRADDDVDGDEELGAEGVLDDDSDVDGDRLDETVAELETRADAEGCDAVALVVDEVDGVVFGDIVAGALCELAAVVVAEVDAHPELTADTDAWVTVALPLFRGDADPTKETVALSDLVSAREIAEEIDGGADGCAVVDAAEVRDTMPELDGTADTDSVTVGASERRLEAVGSELRLTGSLASPEMVTTAEALGDEVAASVCVVEDDGDPENDTFPDDEVTPVVCADNDADSVGRDDSLESGEADAERVEMRDALESAEADNDAVEWRVAVDSPLFDGVRDSADALTTGDDDVEPDLRVVDDGDGVDTTEMDVFREADDDCVLFSDAVAAVLAEAERVSGDADCDEVRSADALL